MRNPVFREFYTERDVVQEERRQRVDTNPRGQLMEAALATAFTAVPYRHPVLGWPGDLENLNRPQAQAYFKTHYAPNNALAVLVGDLDPAAVIRVVEQYFGDLPAQPLPVPPLLEEPPQTGERRVRVEFPAEPSLLMLYQVPALGHPDTYPIAVLGSLLGEGRSSRLYKRLVEERRLATSICGGPLVPPARRAVPDPGHPARPAHRRTRWRPPSTRRSPAWPRSWPPRGRCSRSGTRPRWRPSGSLASNAGLASQLGNAWALTGDWRTLFSDQEKLQAVTAEEVRDASHALPAAPTSDRGHAGPRERDRARRGQARPARWRRISRGTRGDETQGTRV